jgi:hypothetical protein
MATGTPGAKVGTGLESSQGVIYKSPGLSVVRCPLSRVAQALLNIPSFPKFHRKPESRKRKRRAALLGLDISFICERQLTACVFAIHFQIRVAPKQPTTDH